jgi:hypothetical protein
VQHAPDSWRWCRPNPPRLLALHPPPRVAPGVMALGASIGVGSALAHRLERPQQVGWLAWESFGGRPGAL